MLRTLLRIVLFALLPFGSSFAQDHYPSKSVEVLSVFGAGGGTDILARVYAAEMTKLLGQSFVVINREGAAGSIGFAALASAKPDGYTISFAPATPLVNSPHVIKNLSYGFDSIVPVCGVFENVFAVVVLPSSPYKTLKDLLAAAKAKPGELSYGNAGLGSIPHLSMAALTRAAGVTMIPIAYRGDSGVLPQVMSGTLTVGIVALSSIMGRDMRVLAVFNDHRDSTYPDAPAVTELGFPKIPPGLNGVFVPKGLPKAVFDTLERTCKQVTSQPPFIAAAKKLNQTVEFYSGAEYAKILKADYDFKGQLIKDIGFGQ